METFTECSNLRYKKKKKKKGKLHDRECCNYFIAHLHKANPWAGERDKDHNRMQEPVDETKVLLRSSCCFYCLGQEIFSLCAYWIQKS